jgi:GTP-binding protein HflX
VILVGVSEGDGAESDTADSMAELGELVKTAGAQVAGTVVQNLHRRHPGTYVGTGKVQEIRELLAATDATGVVCDDELTPAQMRNLADLLDTKVMDRTLVILDIFASRAGTSEGKIQVELAQLRYEMTRLTGYGRAMSRLGGGIGTRGPGEKKLEMDRRLITRRISQLKRELAEVVQHREVKRSRRTRSGQSVAAIVGYTNAGKSTLLNTLTDADVLEMDALFATLDPTTRLLTLGGKQEILLTDTVGFIRKLPHHLIDAFRSTLEEAKYADYIIHVVDAASPQMEKQMHIVYETLHRLGVEDKPVLTLFNKMDLVTDPEPLHDARADRVLRICAKSGEGLDQVRDALEELLRENKIYMERLLPYSESGILAKIRTAGELVSEDYRPEGIFIKAYVPRALYPLAAFGNAADCDITPGVVHSG